MFYISAVFFLLFSPSISKSQTDGAEESCFDYYKFQSVTIDLHTDKSAYKAGEGAKFVGSVTNTNSYPLVGGSLILRVSKFDPRSNVGNDIIDEWTAIDDINLLAGEKKSVEIPYQLSSGLSTGTYVLTSYFVTQGKFNLAGLSFSDDIHGGYANFSVEGKSEKTVKFDRNGVKINNEPYRIFGLIPRFFTEDAKALKISVPLKNETASDLSASIEYSLYYWDAANKKNLVKEWTSAVEIKKNSSKELFADIDVVEKTVYFLKIKATFGDKISEIHVRIAKIGFRPRLNFIGVNQFPLTGEEGARMFVCYHNTTELSDPAARRTLQRDSNGKIIPPASETRNGKLELMLKNFSGRVLSNAVFEGGISGDVEVFAKDLKNRLDNFVISAKLYDDKGNVVDEADVVYDCSKFSENICSETSINYYYFGAGFLILVLAVYLATVHYKRNEKINEPAKT